MEFRSRFLALNSLIRQVILLLCFPAYCVLGQTVERPSAEPSRVIEDNSFLIEEAYNQENGVVQHISNGILSFGLQKDILYSFTQEWPVGGQSHQLSYTVPYSLPRSDRQGGIGDVLLNYRYQFFGHDDWAAVAPRLSIIVPTGSASSGMGSGVLGLQLNMPASKRLSNFFVVHLNAGFTLLPGVRQQLDSGGETQRNLISANLGGSLVWLIADDFNFMLEYLTNYSTDMQSNGTTRGSIKTIVNPAFRYAVNVGSMQIVPGIGIPITFDGGALRAGMFLYLSFEHPF